MTCMRAKDDDLRDSVGFHGMSSNEDHQQLRVRSQEYTPNLKGVTGTRMQSKPSGRYKQYTGCAQVQYRYLT